MNILKSLQTTLLLVLSTTIYAQQHIATDSTLELDSLKKELPKVLHAEPLFIDLIRDLGARKGEKEWNIGIGMTDNLEFDEYETLIEYEWAPIDRLGLEIELPFTFHSGMRNTAVEAVPANRLNSLKLAGQYTFFVSEKLNTSLAMGYINEFEFSDFKNFGNPLIYGNVYNPFFVAAKRWGRNFHTLVYTGPRIFHHFKTKSTHTAYDINSNIHYMIEGTRNFIGIEFNKSFEHRDFDMTIRPQMRLTISDQTMLGIVVGVPIARENQRMSSFLRLIWEPSHKK